MKMFKLFLVAILQLLTKLLRVFRPSRAMAKLVQVIEQAPSRRYESYLTSILRCGTASEAARMREAALMACPNASAGTKRRWQRAVDFKRMARMTP